MVNQDYQHSGRLLGLFLIAIGLMAASAWAQTADYGDAPDQPGSGTFGPAAGHYPTENPTANTVFAGRTGPYHLDNSQEILGTLVDGESAALTINRDFFDDGFRGFLFVAIQIPIPTFTRVAVTIPAGAPPGARYINMAADLNQDGKWEHYTDGIGNQVSEWVVQNFQIDVPTDILPGQTEEKQAGGGGYFEELLARIRDIRSSEKVFWRKVYHP